MRVIGTLVFAFAVIVNSIVCPGFPAGFYPRCDAIPSDYTALTVTPEDYPGAHVKNRATGRLHLVELPLGVFAKGDIIVGRNLNGSMRPIFNSEGQITIRNIATRTTELFTTERAEELGLMSYLSARARARARARGQAEVPQNRPNRNSE